MLSDSNHSKGEAAGQVSDTVRSGHHVPWTYEGASAFEKCLTSSVPLVSQVDQPGVLTKGGILPANNPDVGCSWATG